MIGLGRRSVPRWISAKKSQKINEQSMFFAKESQKNMKMVDEDGWILEFRAENDTK